MSNLTRILFYIMNFWLSFIGKLSPIKAKKLVNGFAEDSAEIYEMIATSDELVLQNFMKNIDYYLAWEKDRNMSIYK